MLAALIALAASFCFGSSNFIAGLESRRRSVWSVTAVSQVASALSAGVLLAFADHPFPAAGPVLWAVVAGAAAAAGILSLYRALAVGAMSVVSPIIALQVVLPVVVGTLQGEKLAAVTWLGVILAVGGVVLVARARAPHARVPREAVLLAVLTAVLFGVMLVGIDQAGAAGGDRSWVVFVVRVASAAVVLVFFVATHKRLDVSARALPGIVVVGVLLTAATFLFSAALAVGLLSVVSVLGSLSPVVTTALAQVFLHERLERRQWLGMAAVLLGVVLLSV